MALGRARCPDRSVNDLNQVAGAGRGRPQFLVGRDTRWSGPVVQAALSAGLAAEGSTWSTWVSSLLPPWPSVAATERLAGRGHFGLAQPLSGQRDQAVRRGGRKLRVADEERVEALMHNPAFPGAGRASPSELAGTGLGRLRPTRRPDPGTAVGRWRSSKAGSLEGIRLVIDRANGAARPLHPRSFPQPALTWSTSRGDARWDQYQRALWVDRPLDLAWAVRSQRADAGLAFDGDADRIIAVDETGTIIDGDRLLGLFAVDLHRRGRLVGDTVVVTVMTNLGFHLAMAEAGISVEQTPVGDRHVLEALEGHGWSLGASNPAI